MSEQHEVHHLAALEEVFNQIRIPHAVKGDGVHVDKAWLQQSLSSVVQKLASEHEFVLGAFVHFELEGGKAKPTLLPLNEGELFFGEAMTTAFKTKAYETLGELKNGGKMEGSLFLSELVWNSFPHRARMVQLAISCKCGSCSNKNFTLNGWGTAYDLGSLHDSISKEEGVAIPGLQQKEDLYSKAIEGYFPKNNDCHFLVYCPFLIADGKPPGNFFGVFRRCSTACSRSHDVTADANILKWVTFVQMAGTLAFSQLSLKSLSKIENHEKFKNVMKFVDDARVAGERAVAEMHKKLVALEDYLNPDGCFAGVEEFGKLKSEMGEYFGRNGHFSGTGTLHDPKNWKRDDVNLFCTKFQNKCPGLQQKLAGNNFETLFKYWQLSSSPDHIVRDERPFYSAPYIAKMLSRSQLPLLWLEEFCQIPDEFRLRGIVIGNYFADKQIAVFTAINLLVGLGATAEIDGKSLQLKIEIFPEKAKGGENALNNLPALVQELTARFRDGASISSHGQSTTVLAILADASALETHPNRCANGRLRYQFDFGIEPEFA